MDGRQIHWNLWRTVAGTGLWEGRHGVLPSSRRRPRIGVRAGVRVVRAEGLQPSDLGKTLFGQSLKFSGSSHWPIHTLQKTVESSFESKIVKCSLLTHLDPTRPSPWVDPTNVRVWSSIKPACVAFWPVSFSVYFSFWRRYLLLITMMEVILLIVITCSKYQIVKVKSVEVTRSYQGALTRLTGLIFRYYWLSAGSGGYSSISVSGWSLSFHRIRP